MAATAAACATGGVQHLAVQNVKLLHWNAWWQLHLELVSEEAVELQAGWQLVQLNITGNGVAVTLLLIQPATYQ